MVNKGSRRWASPQCAVAVGDAAIRIAIGVILAAACVFSGCSKDDAERDTKHVYIIKAPSSRLASHDDGVHGEAVRALVREKGKAIGPLAAELRSRDENVCMIACLVLSEIGEPAVGVLIGALRDNDVRWPHYAAWALSRIGPYGVRAVDALLVTLREGDSDSRAMAALALGTNGPGVAIAEPAWLEAVKAKHNGVRISPTQVLLAARPATDDVFAASVAALDDDTPLVRINAVLAFIALGPKARKAVPRLEALAKDPVPKVRKYAHIALARAEPTEARILTVVEFLTDIEANISEVCIAGLKAMGPTVRRFVPAIVRGMQDETSDVDLRAAMAKALGHIGPNAEQAVSALGKATGSRHEPIRWNAVRSLGRIGPAARPMIPRIISFLKDRDEGMRMTAAAALGQIGHGSPEVVSALIDALQTDPGQFAVREEAAKALGKIAPPAEAAIPVLEKARNHKFPDVREAAAEALRKIKAAKGESSR